MNEYPKLDEATPDEHVRLVSDQQRFGGHCNALGSVTYGDHDSVFFIQSDPATTDATPTSTSTSASTAAVESAATVPPATAVSASSGAGSPTDPLPLSFFSPVEWRAHCADLGASAPRVPQVVALDLNGHYTVALAALVERPGTGQPAFALVNFNTSATNYLGNPTLAWTFDAFALRFNTL
jgi:hypothetical protein